jgi:hypothetical protein
MGGVDPGGLHFLPGAAYRIRGSDDRKRVALSKVGYIQRECGLLDPGVARDAGYVKANQDGGAPFHAENEFVVPKVGAGVLLRDARVRAACVAINTLLKHGGLQ